MHERFLRTAAIIGGLSVSLGAFGAHTLKNFVTPEAVATFETGVRYQFYHCFALLVVGILYPRFPGKWMVRAGNAFIIGIVLFSGSLYALTLLQATQTVGLRSIGIITPIGGLFFIAGWLFLLIGLYRRTPTE